MTITVRSNLPEFSRQLRAIKVDMQVRAVKAAVGAAARVFAKAAAKSDRFQSRSGRLRKAIYGVASKYRKGQDVVYGVVAARQGRKYQRVKRGKRVVNLDAFYWAWVEGGHVKRGPGQRVAGGRRRKALERERLRKAGQFVPGRFYLRSAFQSQQQASLDAFTKRLQISLDKYSRGQV